MILVLLLTLFKSDIFKRGSFCPIIIGFNFFPGNFRALTESVNQFFKTGDDSDSYDLMSVIPYTTFPLKGTVHAPSFGATESEQCVDSEDVSECTYRVNHDGFNICIWSYEFDDPSWTTVVNNFIAAFVNNSWWATISEKLADTEKPSQKSRSWNKVQFPILPSNMFATLFVALNSALSEVLFDKVLFFFQLLIISRPQNSLLIFPISLRMSSVQVLLSIWGFHSVYSPFRCVLKCWAVIVHKQKC